MTESYIRKLIAAYPCITEIWLLGSRANGTARPDSDWDYFARADDARILNALCRDKSFNDPTIDLFVGTPGADEIIHPWPDAEGQYKKLGLGSAPGGIDWQVQSSTQAQYRATKFRDSSTFAVNIRTQSATLVYRR